MERKITGTDIATAWAEACQEFGIIEINDVREKILTRSGPEALVQFDARLAAAEKPYNRLVSAPRRSCT